jgi:hypothetical protein
LARPGGHSAKRRTLRIAPTAEGALIARLDAHWFEGFQPYSPGSGDGIPLPWTWKRAHVWLRTEPFSEAALARLSAREAGTAEEPATTDGWQQDPVYLANQALENPPPTAGLEAAEARIRQAAPRGMHMLVVVPRDSGWHVSVAVQDDAQLMLFLSNLGQQEDVEQVQHDVLVRGRTSDGAMSTAVYVRFASRMRMTPER